MENIKMKTGIAAPDEPSDNIKTFILIFMAIIWRRVWITTMIYCDHNKITITKDVVLKALKFNIYSEAGIGNTLKPYIIKALKDGFLMPQDYSKNVYATRAIKLYKSAYNIVRMKDRDEEVKFLKEYAFKVFDINNNITNDITEENKDIINSITRGDHNNDLENEGNECLCKMCELVDSWDINESLIFSSDPFQNTIMKGLTSALDGGY